MIQSRGTLALLATAAVLLAGCGAGVDGGPQVSDTVDSPAGDEGGTATGTLAFYVSDRPAAIDDFASLTATVTEIGVHRASAGDEDDAAPASGDEANETDAGDDSAALEGGTPMANLTAAPSNESTTLDANETETDSPPATENSTEDGPGTEDGKDTGSQAADGSGWITYSVENATVDLTELRGANASKIADFRVPAGEYNGVTMAVSNVTGTLTTGETVSVKLPSDTLRLNKGFTLGANRSTSFVFDVAVHEAGGSGKYVLRPVIGESGTNVPIVDVETGRADRWSKTRVDDATNGSAGAELQAKLTGPVKTGQAATVLVHRGNAPAPNATVVVNGETVGVTDADGRLDVEVPDADAIIVVVRDGDDEVRIERVPK